MKLKLLGALALLSSLPTCSDPGEAAVPGGARGAIIDSSGGTVALGLHAIRYRPAAPGPAAVIGGTISLQGAPRDSVVAVTRDSNVCGDSASVFGTQSNGNTLANALVWVDGIASGKALPEIRRETLVIKRCRFDPRIIAIVSRSTINILSRDRAEHETRFYREGSADPVEEVHTFDAGQVVPSEKIASVPGIVEVRCTRHPWARAYIAVFDHPYFAVTDEQGAFKIDGLPPGTYNVKVWHERLLNPVEQRVVLGAGGSARLDLSLPFGET